VRDLRVHVAKTIIRNDFRSAKVLEFGGIRAGFGSEMNEMQSALKAAVVIGSNIGNEPGGVIVSNQGVTNLKFHVSSP